MYPHRPGPGSSSRRPAVPAAAALLLLVAGSARAIAPYAPAAVERLRAATGGRATVALHPATGAARWVTLPLGSPDLALPPIARPEERAEAFVRAHGSLFGVGWEDLAPAPAARDRLGWTHLRYLQRYRQLPVYAGELRFHFDPEGNLVRVQGVTVPGIDLSTTPRHPAEEAAATARAAAEQEPLDPARHPPPGAVAALAPRLLVLRTGLVQGVAGRSHLAWEVEVADPGLAVHERVYVDARTGKVLDRIPLLRPAIDRQAYDGGFDSMLLVWSEGDSLPTGDPDIDNMLFYAEDVYDTFSSLTNGAFPSWDGADGTLHTVLDDPGLACPDADWTGVYTRFCTGFTADDVVAHEWGHAYTDSTHDLVHQWQPGALDEAYSDIWGETIDLLNGAGTDAPGGSRSDGACSQYGTGSPATDDSYRWLLGEDASPGALRDLWRPVCFGDPGKVSDSHYSCSSADAGGVHTNSGVPDHAFALLVDGGSYNGQTVTGIGLTRAAAIYWRAQTVYQTPASSFADHADALEVSCADLVGQTLYEPDPDSPTGTEAAELIAAGDCDQVAAAVAAVELRADPVQCNFQPLLDPDSPGICDGNAPDSVVLAQDFEAGLGSWSVGTRDVASNPDFDTPDWAVVSGLPGSRAGSAAFVQDDPSLGDCAADDESGVLYLESPAFVLPASPGGTVLGFDHWVATEERWDGGNLKYRLNKTNNEWLPIPTSAFTFNPYNSTLYGVGGGNTNPLAGEPAFTGANPGTLGGSWGQSLVDLGGLASPGDTVWLRFEMGLDGCGGLVGWYVDDVEVAACSLCGNGALDGGESCDDGNRTPGDGCDADCAVEAGWSCTDPVPAVTGIVADGDFEEGWDDPDAGYYNGWELESSVNAENDTPICDTGCGEAQPSEGEWFAWFGSWFEPETATLSQDVTTPSGGELVLNFDLDVDFCDSPSDYLDIYLDGNPVFTTDPCTITGGYVHQQVDVSSYADGGTHTLLLKGETFLLNSESGSFLVDQVDLSVPARPSECTPTGGCTPVVNLENETITGSDTRTACQTLTAGNGFVVDATGDLRLVAGQTVVLADGFSVLAGGALTVEIDPSLLP